eukprot:TRINITY_DN35912_c0_g1_i1.p3 TRINITY_DN35912_c0_g1~~TRINITY_DN35912_c0_g1_i1.p3  ORF type:complete len:155 (+),score=5.73 TRINITY_DN35912_c0_g1_i1:42-506(+)
MRRPPRSTHCISSAASDVYKRQTQSTWDVGGPGAQSCQPKAIGTRVPILQSLALQLCLERNSQYARAAPLCEGLVTLAASPGKFAREDADEPTQHDVSQDDFDADDKSGRGSLRGYVTEPEGSERHNAVIKEVWEIELQMGCLLYTSPSPRDQA